MLKQFFYIVGIIFPPFLCQSSNVCPTLDAKQLCGSFYDGRGTSFKIDPKNKRIVSSFCANTPNNTSSQDFKGNFMGNIIKCAYKIPEEWAQYMDRKSTYFSIMGKTQNTEFQECPILSFDLFENFIFGAVYSPQKDQQWRMQDKSERKRMWNTLKKKTAENNKTPVKSITSKIYTLCAYSLNGPTISVRFTSKNKLSK